MPLFFNCLLYFALHICYVGQKRVQFSVLNICCRYLTCHDVLSALEEEETSAMAIVFIEPNDGRITDEDSADEDDGGLVDNLSGNQLNAMAEAV